MAVHELNSTEYVTMETELEKELPYSICVRISFYFIGRLNFASLQMTPMKIDIEILYCQY